MGSAGNTFRDAIRDRASSRVTGYGLDEGVQMGPVISTDSRTRIEGLIERATKEGGRVLLDGRKPNISKYEKGAFLKPTLLEGLPAASEVMRTEIFGPVLALHHVEPSRMRSRW